MKVRKPLIATTLAATLLLCFGVDKSQAATITSSAKEKFSNSAPTKPPKVETITPVGQTKIIISTSASASQNVPKPAAKSGITAKEILCAGLIGATSMLSFSGPLALLKLGLGLVGGDIIYRGCSK
jgi:hypothetical protein